MEEQFKIRLEKLQKLQDLGVAAYPYAYDRTHSFAQIKEAFGRRDQDELEQMKPDGRAKCSFSLRCRLFLRKEFDRPIEE